MSAPSPRPGSKILTPAELSAARDAARSQGRSVVQCHGCFDIVHPGHVRHLRFARAQGDILLVTVTGDGQIEKGSGRPLIPQELRAENLAELDCVDWVCIDEEATAASLLERTRPDVYVKGREYEFNNDPRFQAERAVVERHGGRVVFSSGDVVFSSTALIASLEGAADPFHARLTQLLRDPSLAPGALGPLIASFRGKRVVVVGESLVDTYVLCDRPDVASEGPIMTLRPIERRRYDGGSAIIARHLAAMGASPVLVTPMPMEGAGADEAEEMRRRLAGEGVEVRPFAVRARVGEKQRFLVGAQKVMKLDLLDPITLDAGEQERFLGAVSGAARERGGADAAIVADFAQGLFTPKLARRVCRALRTSAGVVTGDVSGRRAGLRDLHGLDLACPSEAELRDAFGAYDEGLPAVTWTLLKSTRTTSAIVTMGAEGLIAFERTSDAEAKDGAWHARLHAHHIPSLVPHAIDPLGCGDALLAAATLTLSAGGSLLAAALLGSVAAAAHAQRIGNVPASATDLRRGLARVHAATIALEPPDVVGGSVIRLPEPPRALRA